MRNIPAKGESAPRREKSLNCGESLDMWLTIRSATNSCVSSESAYVIPITKAGVDFGVICRVETSIGSVDGMKKRKQVHAAEDTPERAVEQGSQLAEIAGQTINVSDELDLIFQGRTISSDRGRTSGKETPTRT